MHSHMNVKLLWCWCICDITEVYGFALQVDLLMC